MPEKGAESVEVFRCAIAQAHMRVSDFLRGRVVFLIAPNADGPGVFVQASGGRSVGVKMLDDQECEITVRNNIDDHTVTATVGYCSKCGRCGKYGPLTISASGAIDEARAAGWQYKPGFDYPSGMGKRRIVDPSIVCATCHAAMLREKEAKG